MIEEVPTELVRQERAQREATIREGIRQTTIDLRIGRLGGREGSLRRVIGEVVSRSVLRGVDDEASQTRLLLYVVELADVERIDVYTWAVEVVTCTRDDVAIGECLYTRADLRQREVGIPAEGVGVKDV